MRQVIGKLVVDSMSGGARERVFQDGARNSRILLVQGDEGIPGMEGYFNRDRGIGELYFADWIFTLEDRFGEARKAFKPSAAITLPLQSLVINFQHREGPLH